MNQEEQVLCIRNRNVLALQKVVYFLLPLIAYLAVESSSNVFNGIGDVFQQLAHIPFLRHVAGYAALLMVTQLLVLLLGRVRLALNLSAVLTTALAIGNLLVHQMHGTPFTFSMLRNAGTALTVLSSYSIPFGARGVWIVCLFAAELLCINLVFRKVRCDRKKALAPAGVLCVVLLAAYAGPWAWIPDHVVSWSWNDAIHSYGYTNCLVQSTIHGLHSTIKPDDYDPAALEALAAGFEPEQPTQQLPDVILILNETFYDLRQISAVDPDGEYLSRIGSLENSLTGYTVVPEIGGGTNKSEYELLTSNSLHLAPNATPFNEFDLEGANSVVSYLEGLGYESMAAHPADAQNYMRNEGYPGLGFDQVHFQEDFQDLTYYQSRVYPSDESLFDNMIRWYEQMGDGPRLAYLLTFQNHGGHKQLKPEDLRVHAGVDYGEHDAEVDEFLTCIDLSDQAFLELTEYFSQQDRDVIVCMMGDHSPVFAPDLVTRDLSSTEEEFRLRSTPYVIWSNHIDLTEKELPTYLSAVYLTPAVLQLAEVPLSGYYSYMMDLMQHAPVLSDFNYYVTADKQLFSYEDESPLYRAVTDYMGFAYANINREPFMDRYTAAAQP